MKQKQQVRFSDFIKLFPVVELPVTLRDDSHHDFSLHNPPLPSVFTEAFLSNIDEKEEEDEFTEYISCFRLPNTENFHAIVYWKASLLTYTYTLACFDKKGSLIEKKDIAGTNVKGELLIKSIATIDEEWTIYIAGGAGSLDEVDYNPTNTQSITLQLLETGKITAFK